MSFDALPNDLKNLVSGFAYSTNWSQTEADIEMCIQIIDAHISPMFLRQQLWSWPYRSFLPSPLVSFQPLNQLTGRWSDIVDWNVVNELMFRLDYRRSLVKVGGTRSEWFAKFKSSWLQICLFDAFYRLLLQSDCPIYKPTYTSLRCQQLGGNSPIYSARWVLEDWDTFGRSSFGF